MSYLATVMLVLLGMLPWQSPVSITRPLENLIVSQPGGESPLAQPATIAMAKLPIRVSNPTLNLQAPSALAVDVTTAQTLYAKDDNTQRPIASVTKLVTALVILEHHKLTDKVTVPALPAYGPEDELLGLRAGEVFTVNDLLRAALIHSANDAADALAIIDSGSREVFATHMNSYVAQWGIGNAHFSNPTGLSDAGNAASAGALSKIALIALRHPDIRKITLENGGTITDADTRVLTLRPTNSLLSEGRFSGIKTGYTLAAGGCFVGLATVNGHEIITVILGSPDRFGETVQLTNWIQTNYTWL